MKTGKRLTITGDQSSRYALRLGTRLRITIRPSGVRGKNLSQPACNAMLACASKRSIAGRSSTALACRGVARSAKTGRPLSSTESLSEKGLESRQYVSD